jgi:hypothetical protein
MIRRIMDFVYILVFVWAGMFMGLWIIHSLIVPLELPGIANPILTGILRGAISAILALVWLWMWREMVRRMFWQAIKEQQLYIKEPEDNKRDAGKA